MKPAIDIDIPSGLTQHSILTIRTCTTDHAAATLARAHAWRKNVGWLPRAAVETNIERGWVWRALIDGEDAGHVMLSGGERSPYTLRHNCIDEALWNNGLGATMTGIFLAYARLTSAHTHARVRTRADLIRQTKINMKWGFEATKVDRARKTTRHRVVTWERQVRHPNARKRVTDRVDIESIYGALNDLEDA